MIYLLSTDLLFLSQIQAAAVAAGIDLRPCLSVDTLLQATESEVEAGLLIDLEAPSLDVADLLKRLTHRERRRVIAYGPHVHAGRLQAAREAGCDEVLSRGGLHSQLSDVLARLNSGPRQD